MKLYSDQTLSAKSFPFYLRRSTYVHAALLSLTLIGGKVVLEQQQKMRDKNMELIQASVRVDMVSMPKYTLNELKNLSSGVEEAKPEVKSEPTPEPVKKEIVEPKVETAPKEVEKPDNGPTLEEAEKEKHQNFLSKLKQIGNKKIKSEGNQKADKGFYGDKSTDLKQLVLAGNKLSKGTQMYGSGNSADLTAFQVYASRLPDLVRPHWRLPSFLMDKNLKCRIRVWLNLNGEVTRTEVYQSSGEAEYDQRAVEAVKSTSPFPKLSEDYVKRALNGDILLGFPL